jgi:hypothetical protein
MEAICPPLYQGGMICALRANPGELNFDFRHDRNINPLTGKNRSARKAGLPFRIRRKRTGRLSRSNYRNAGIVFLHCGNHQ